MIISRTPFRISFFGGGTDYPAWYRKHGGAALATTISKYCYITCRWLPPFFEHRSRVVWRLVELVKDNAEIQHPSVRATLQRLGISRGVELHHDGDLPARTGLGSSSAFTVGLLNALNGLLGSMTSKMELTREAIQIEQEILKENVGSQDQTITAHGGFNRMEFGRDGSIRVNPILLGPERLVELQDHMLLIYTGLSRTASEIAREQIQATAHKETELRQMREMVEEAVRILQSGQSLEAFGKLLHESWLLKRSLTTKVSTPLVDEVYERALRTGAVGGKLLGAGGGGFLLLFAAPEDQPRVLEALDGFLHVPFRFETEGSRIIFYEPDGTAPEKGAAALSAAGTGTHAER